MLDGLKHLGSGKVRELYAVDDETLLLVATDRLSAYDWVLPTPIPDKGRVLTRLSLWWFEQLADLVPHHLVTTELPSLPGVSDEEMESLRGRAMLCRRLDMIPVECVARGYLAGSGLAEYTATSAVCGVELPSGLVDGSELPEPIFTPATKAAVGEHDENVSFAEIARQHGVATAERLRDTTLAIYRRAADIARERGIILADTKFEFGADRDGRLVLADEVLTPDSSRFWPAERWRPGGAQPSFDKQFVRDWLTSPASGWDRHSGEAPPELPTEIVERTRSRYIQAYEMLTGRQFG
jgi:phosphoribosylaminoimidazole-succinocarboxamide synthase